MTVAIVLAAIIAMYAAASLYVRKASAYLTASDAPWERMYEAAKTVIADQCMPRDAANFAAAAVMCAGCGCLTRQILFDSALRTLGRRRKPSKRPRPDMDDAQMELMSKVVVNAIYYDSLRAPISGTICVNLFILGFVRLLRELRPLVAKASEILPQVRVTPSVIVVRDANCWKRRALDCANRSPVCWATEDHRTALKPTPSRKGRGRS